jgi:hypothetical protein
MNAKRLLTAWMLILFACTAGAADKASSPPDPELLEFLGTFVTARGKEIDPLLLEKGAPNNDVQKKGERKPAPREAVKKKTPPHGREHEDE